MPALSRTCPTQPQTSLRPYECRSKRRTCDSESDSDSDSDSSFFAFFAFFAFACIDQTRVCFDFPYSKISQTIRALTA